MNREWIRPPLPGPLLHGRRGRAVASFAGSWSQCAFKKVEATHESRSSFVLGVVLEIGTKMETRTTDEDDLQVHVMVPMRDFRIVDTDR